MNLCLRNNYLTMQYVAMHSMIGRTLLFEIISLSFSPSDITALHYKIEATSLSSIEISTLICLFIVNRRLKIWYSKWKSMLFHFDNM